MSSKLLKLVIFFPDILESRNFYPYVKKIAITRRKNAINYFICDDLKLKKLPQMLSSYQIFYFKSKNGKIRKSWKQNL